MIADLPKDPPDDAPGEKPRRRRAPVSIGHAGRLNLSWRTRWPIVALIVTFVASQMVDEIVGWVEGPLGLAPAQATVLEITLGLILFLLCGAFMLAWVRGVESRRDRD